MPQVTHHVKAAAQTLAWCIEAGGILGHTVPAGWHDMAAHPYLPLSDTLYSKGPVHLQDATYKGGSINQADVALLQ